jgi:hypothetical protein
MESDENNEGGEAESGSTNEPLIPPAPVEAESVSEAGLVSEPEADRREFDTTASEEERTADSFVPSEAAGEVEGAAPADEDLEPEPEPEVFRPERRKSHVAPALIAIDRIDDDDTFRIRPEGDLSLLATDLARLGQLFPVELRLKPPDRFQIICGFRRVAALRFLQRDKVLARLHTDISDEDALLMALAAAIHVSPVKTEELAEMKAKLKEEGRLSAATRDMLDKALSPGDDLAPEHVGEEEVDADELAVDVLMRAGALNQDLALLAEAFNSLDDDRKKQLLEQLRYSAELVAFLEGK